MLLLQHFTKKCTNCNTTKNFDDFCKHKNTKDGLQQICKYCQKEYRVLNKHIAVEYSKQYRTSNKEYLLYKKKEYRQNNKDIIKDSGKKYRSTAIGRASKINNNHKRRSLTKQGDVTKEQILHIQQNTKVCYWCKCSLKNIDIHIDHYVPLSKGGHHTISNLVVTCNKCNMSKHTKDPILFANSLGRLL